MEIHICMYQHIVASQQPRDVGTITVPPPSEEEGEAREYKSLV